jgi:dihydropteroate synthase
MKKKRIKNIFLENLKTVPIVQISCDKASISRNSVYRWRKEDKEFANEMDKAMAEGEDFINDISEGQLFNLIKEKSWPALAFWLRHRNPKFKERIEITTKVRHIDELSPEQERTIKDALKLAGLIKEENDSNK